MSSAPVISNSVKRAEGHNEKTFNGDTVKLSNNIPITSVIAPNTNKMNVQVENVVRNKPKELTIENYSGDRSMCAMPNGARAHMGYTLCDKKSKLLANLNN